MHCKVLDILQSLIQEEGIPVTMEVVRTFRDSRDDKLADVCLEYLPPDAYAVSDVLSRAISIAIDLIPYDRC